MSWLVEQAGGASTNSKQCIMDLQPSKLHERVSVVLGSKNEVERLTAYHHEAQAGATAGLRFEAALLVQKIHKPV